MQWFKQFRTDETRRHANIGRQGLTACVLSAAIALLTACGGGTSGSGDTATDKPASSADAQRFLTQATFGPSQADIDRLNQIGYSQWIDEQLAMAPQQSHVSFFDQRDAEIKADNPTDANAKARTNEFLQSFYTRALTDPAQLKQRIAFALSEIFVVSTQDSFLGENTRLVASYLDMLTTRGTGPYRALLEGVTLHPAMGIYLSSLNNQKEDGHGRVPDENYAREVMQLFSIGLYQLNTNGTVKTSGGKPIETYTGDDIKGLARVFTGWSWYASDSLVGANAGAIWKCLYRDTTCRDSEAYNHSMRAYAAYHSTSVKTFLGTSTNADAAGDLKVTLDTLANHPNTAPFISKQLIQRFVTSNPSPAYVNRIAQVFTATNGNIGQVVKAILLDPDARGATSLSDPNFGKVREPVLRMTALLRAFKHASDAMTGLSTGPGRTRYYDIRVTDDAGTSLGQSPLRAPSVFNFYRPGYVPPQSQAASQGLVAPEMQIVSETSVAGYVNFMKSGLQSGLGNWNKYDSNGDGVIDSTTRPDVQFDFSAEKTLADKPADLVDRVGQRLLQGRMSAALHDQIVAALGTVAIPGGNASAASIDAARLRRVQAAIFLALVSPEYVVQK